VVFPNQYVEIDLHGILVIRPSKPSPEAVR
jgi:hypothetical protein